MATNELVVSSPGPRVRPFVGRYVGYRIAGYGGFTVGMDMGWVVNFVSPENATAQVIVVEGDGEAGVQPDLTIEVDDVDRLHAQAVERGYEIVHPLTDEPWGVRRFFVEDPDGKVVNVMTHLDASGDRG